MISSVWLLLGAVVAYWLFSNVSQWQKNIAKARKTGLPVIIAPCNPHNLAWQTTHKLWVPVIKLLPRAWWEDWLDVSVPGWSWRHLRKPFERYGDTFIIASPGGIIMSTSDAAAISQITASRERFPKPLEPYAILSLFGLNVLVTEGSVWRFHRKVTSASFNERNAAHTFAEAIQQTRGMVQRWLGPDGRGSRTVETVEKDTMTLALNIIGYVGFGLRLLWPGQSLPEGVDPKLAKYATAVPPDGHTMTFADALATVLARILLLLMFPSFLLKILPWKEAKQAHEAYDNYERYMQEFMQDKIEEVRNGDRGEGGMDIMGQLVRSKYGKDGDATSGDSSGTKDSSGISPTTGAPSGTITTMTDKEIISNAFIIMLAGHETTANTIHFCLLYLAANPAAQRRLQRDVDAQFGPDSDPAAWGYEDNINAMMAGMLGACMNETLRLMPAVVGIPKEVSRTQDQAIRLGAATHVLPAGMNISLVALGVHRNPLYWPAKPSRVTGGPSDLDDFVPDRWFLAGGEGDTGSAEKEAEAAAEVVVDTEDFGGYRGPDTSAQLFRPPRGAFVPFSEGARSCLGRRIAQVEVVAALAVIFQRCSIELAVDEWATDAEVAAMSQEERRRLYDQATEKYRATVRSARSVLTLKLHGKQFVPVRLVPRGQERFVDWVDA